MLFGHTSYADIEDLTVSTGCTQTVSYTGILGLNKQAYDVYVRLAKRGQTADVESYVQSVGSDFGVCDKVGRVAANGDRWTKIGQFSAHTSSEYVIELASPILGKIPDANRPAVMLLPQKTPVCIPKTECVVTVEGETGYIRPTGTLLNQDSLKVVHVVNPHTDVIQQVRYYTDDTFAYSTKNLEEFDTRYISYGRQKLTRVVVYESGQSIVLEGASSIGFNDSFSHFVFRVTQKYPKILNVSIVTAILLFVISIVYFVFSAIRRKEEWRIQHGFKKERNLNALQKLYYMLRSNKIAQVLHVGSLGIVAIVLMGVAIVLVNNYILQITTVDGVSMQKTFYTGDQVFVNKLPKTIANLNGVDYVPDRGQVVIVNANFGNSIATNTNSTNITLIKRVLALPGERVIIKNGQLRIYNSMQPEGFEPDKGSKWAANYTPDYPTENIDIQLGSNEIFVSGDNRPESIDSRFNGPIKLQELIGVVGAKIWQIR